MIVPSTWNHPHRPLSCALLIVLIGGCGGGSPQLRADLTPLAIAGAEPVERDPFTRDQTGAITEDDLIRALETPVFLADRTRVGIIPVTVAYEADEDIPLAPVPEILAGALEDTGFFEVASEVATDWPSDGSIAGLRELAARYRTRYLLLYRHRFVQRDRENPWAAAYLTLIAIPFVPSQTLEVAGVLEATLFDVRSGSLMFTVYERVYERTNENIWGNQRKLRELCESLLDEASDRLADKVVHQVHRLAAARPADPTPTASAAEADAR